MDMVSPAQMRGRNFCRCSSEPNSYRVSAQLCRLQMFWNEASAALTSSEHMLNTTFGRFRPPYRRGCATPVRPALRIASMFSTVLEA